MHNVYVDILNKNTNNNINKKSQTKKKFYSILMKIRLSRQFTTFKKKFYSFCNILYTDEFQHRFLT